MNPVDLLAWAFYTGLALLIVTVPAMVFTFAIALAWGKH